MRKWIVLFVLGLIWANKTVTHAAEPDFFTSVHTDIDATTLESVKVTHHISIRNQVSWRYLQKAHFVLDPIKMTNLRVSSQNKITTEINDHSLLVNFLNPQIGKGKLQDVEVTYTTTDAAVNDTGYLMLTVPSIKAESVASQSASLFLPANFVKPEYSLPSTVQAASMDGFTKLDFNSLSANEAVMVRFGSQRTVKFTQQFTLENQQMTPIETQVILPPDTDHQRVVTTAIEPPPLSVQTDNDQNLIATFKLEPKEKRTISTTHEAALYAKPYTSQPTHKEHTAATDTWPTHQTLIKKTHIDLPLTRALILNIFPQLQSAMANPAAVHDASVLQCFDSKQVCSYESYVDSVITLLRANNIPARKVTGGIISSTPWNRELGRIAKTHVWLEYYNKSANHWVPLDMWYELSTHSDYTTPETLNYVTLSITSLGNSPIQPAISFIDASTPITYETIPPPTPNYKLEAAVVQPLLSFLPQFTALHLLNQSWAAMYDVNFVLSSESGPVETITINRLGPASKRIIPIHNQLPTGRLTLSGASQLYEVIRKSAANPATITAAISMVITASLVAVITGRLLVSRSR